MENKNTYVTIENEKNILHSSCKSTRKNWKHWVTFSWIDKGAIRKGKYNSHLFWTVQKLGIIWMPKQYPNSIPKPCDRTFLLFLVTTTIWFCITTNQELVMVWQDISKRRLSSLAFTIFHILHPISNKLIILFASCCNVNIYQVLQWI